VAARAGEREVPTDELVVIYQLISAAMESLVVYRCPREAAKHLEAAHRACLRVNGTKTANERSLERWTR
jgi:hypothetical protein